MSSVVVLPDPQAPHGGRALLSLPEGSIPDGMVEVRVKSGYSQLWLAPTENEDHMVGVGEANWQPQPHDFGPYPVTREGGRDIVRIGPEIVNKIEEFAPVTIQLDDRSIELNWPDNIMPRVGAALIGGIAGVARTLPLDNQAGRLVGHRQELEQGNLLEDRGIEEAVGGIDQDTNEGKECDDSERDKKKSLSFGVLGGLLLALLLALGIGYWFTIPQGDNVVAEPALPEPVTVDPCSLATLSAIPGGFSAATAALSSCIGQVSAETAFLLIERAAQAGDADALLMLGSLYDPEVTDFVYETSLSVAFADNPALAVEYYSQALDAGSEDAAARLSRACDTLGTASDTLSVGAFNDFCQ